MADENNSFKQVNLQSIEALGKDSRITCLGWGDNEQNEILIGRANKFVKVYELTSRQFTSNLEMENGPIVGLARYDGYLVAGSENGKIQLLDGQLSPTIIEVGDNLSRMRQCSSNKKLVATGGKERQNRLKVWDLTTKQNIFNTKNLPNDHLQLEVPIWDSDFAFFDSNCLASCSRYGYVRVYDMRKQRRPVEKYANSKEQFSYSCLTLHDKMIYCGTTTGIVRAFDSRNLKTHVHTYKGFTGGVKDLSIDVTGKYLSSAALDRFVRVHDANTTAMLYQTYIKSKGTAILFKTVTDEVDDCVIVDTADIQPAEAEEELDEEEVDQKRVLSGRRNPVSAKVGSDDEYEKLFEKMETVGENGDEPPKKKKKFRNFKKK